MTQEKLNYRPGATASHPCHAGSVEECRGDLITRSSYTRIFFSVNTHFPPLDIFVGAVCPPQRGM